MTPRQQKAFRKAFAAQVEQERNGAPIPHEVAALMTKPKAVEQLWQVVATTREGGLLSVAPMMGKPYADEMASTINRYISEGKEKDWINAVVVPMTPISAGVH